MCHQDLSLDEAMVVFREHLSFRQYLPAKHTKYVVKVLEICDGRNGYCFDFNVYFSSRTVPGKPEKFS